MKKFAKLMLVLFLGFAGGVAAKAEDISQIDIHGYISQGFMYSNKNNFQADTKNGTFQFNELGINFTTQVADKLRLGIQFAALDLGDLGNDNIVIDWAYADYHWRDWFGLRLGKIKIPMGLYNKTRDIDMLRTFILLPQSNYSDTFRDTLVAMKGIGVYGEIPNTLGDISYEAIFGTMNIDKDGATTKAIEGSGIFDVESYLVKKAYCWSVTWAPPLDGLSLAVTRVNIDLKMFGTLIPSKTRVRVDSPDIIKIVYAIEYTWKDFVLAAELSRQDFTRITRDLGNNAELQKQVRHFLGYYVSASYRFKKKFETGVYYSEFYVDRNDRDGTRTPYKPPFAAYQKDACLTLRFDPNDHWTFKLEGHLMNGTALCFLVDNPVYTKKWHLLAAKMTYGF